MEKKPTIEQKLEMKNYVLALKERIQSRAEQLEQTCKDPEKCKFSRLQDEIVALADLYKHYYNEIFTGGNKSSLAVIHTIDQTLNGLTECKASMIEGAISRGELIQVTEKAKQILQKACLVGNLGEYADMLLKEDKQEDKDQDER